MHILKNIRVKRENILIFIFFILLAVIDILAMRQYCESRVEQLIR